MDEKLLEVRDYDGFGYKPLVDYGAWRVAILRYLEGVEPSQQKSMERHMQTDEVFVLTCGKGMLLIGGNDLKVNTMTPQVMKIGTIYNVKRATWHSVVLSRDAAVLIVENQDTSEQNSEYQEISGAIRQQIIEAAGREGF